MRRYIFAIILTLITTQTCLSQARTSNRIDLMIDSLEADTSNWKLAATIGSMCREKSQTRKALEYSQKAYRQHPNDTIKKEIALCLYQRGEYRECIDTCKSLLSADSTELNLIAHCYNKLGMTDSVIECRMQLAKYDIENQANIVDLSKTLIGVKAPKEALAFLDKYHAIDSTNTIVNGIRAQALYLCGRPEESCIEYEKIMKSGKQMPNHYFHYGLALLQCKRFRESLTMLLAADSITSESNATVKTQLGMVELDIPEYSDKGLADLETAMQLMAPDAKMMHRIYFSLGDYYVDKNINTAIGYFEKALEQMPDNSDTYYQLSYCYHFSKDIRQEYQCLKKYIELSDKDISNTMLEMSQARAKEIERELFMRGEKP